MEFNAKNAFSDAKADMEIDVMAHSSQSEITARSQQSVGAQVRGSNNFQEFDNAEEQQLIHESSSSTLSGLSNQSREEQSSDGPSQSSAENHTQAAALNESTDGPSQSSTENHTQAAALNESTASLRWADARSPRDFQPTFLPDGIWKQQLAAIRKMDSQSNGGFFQRMALWVKRRIMVESLSVPDPLERETKMLMDEFTERLDQKLKSLDSQHLNQLLAKRKQIFEKFGKFRYIKESELEVPY